MVIGLWYNNGNEGSSAQDQMHSSNQLLATTSVTNMGTRWCSSLESFSWSRTRLTGFMVILNLQFTYLGG